MKIIWLLTIIAGSLVIITSWFFPAQPFNGLSILALACTWVAGAFVLQKWEEREDDVHRN